MLKWEATESAIRGMMILGLSRKQAEAELKAAENRRYAKWEREWFDYDPRKEGKW